VKQVPLNTSRPASGESFSAKVDDEDYALVANHSWSVTRTADGNVYARTVVGGGKRAKPKTILMHRLIMGAGPRDRVLHVSSDGLDNRRDNLQLVRNACPKGITWVDEDGGYFRVRVFLAGRAVSAGTAKTITAALTKQRKKVRELMGESDE
jgi:hypothetical protein